MIGATREGVVRGVATGLYRAGLTAGLAAAAGYARRAPAFAILTYHRVNDHGDPFFPALARRVFERQVAYLARHYVVLAVEDLVERLSGAGVPRQAIAITFDDGYRDTLTDAAPILARFGLPATVFLASGFIGTTAVPWYDRLATAFKLSVQPVVRAPWGEEFRLTSEGSRLAALKRVLAHLKTLPEADFQRTLEVIIDDLRVEGGQGVKNSMLNWDDVHALRGLGFRIGAHTVSHPILSRVSVERARREIGESKRMIELACGSSPRAFAYPNGGPADYTAATVDIVKKAGFTCAVTTRFGLNGPGTSPWELRRGGPWEEHLPSFALKLAWYRLAL
jgi:peptidoglycan/xylan/chitin deacetylase (PgdA/CDA1 family)